MAAHPDRESQDHVPARRRRPGERPTKRPTEVASRPEPEQQRAPEYDVHTLRAMQALTDTALSHLSLDALLPELLDHVRTLMRMDNAAILLLNENTGELVLRAARGPEADLVGQVRVQVGIGFAGSIAATRSVVAIEDVSGFPVSNPMLREKLYSLLGAPLLLGDRLLGVVHVGTAGPHRFSAAEKALLQQVSSSVALAVERAQFFESERDARLALQRQASLINLSFEPIFAWSMEGGIVEWNAGAEQLYGYAQAEALGRISHDLLRTVHPLPLHTVLAALERDGQWSGELRQTTKDGREVVVESRQQLIDLGGQRLILETNRNITERWAMQEALHHRTRELEDLNAQLRTLLDVLPAGVAIVDANGKPQLVNDALRQTWGETMPLSESTMQYGVYKAWHTNNGQRVANDEWGLVRALTHGETSIGHEYDIEAFDGKRKAILDSAAPLRNQDGAIVGAVSVVFDITQRRQLEQRTREALEAFIAITRTLVDAPEDVENVENDEDTSDAHDGSPEPEAVLSRHESPLARRLAELTRSILGCSRVSVSEVEAERMLARPVTIVGLTPELELRWWAEQEAQQPQVAGAGLLPEDRDRLLAGEIITLDLTRPPYEIPNEYGATAILAAPMRTQGLLVGILALDFLEPDGKAHDFTPEEIQIAAAVARLGAVVLERDRLLREREVARAEVLALAEANRRMDEFLGIAGHELRTPITTVKANLQMVERRVRKILQDDRAPDGNGTGGTGGAGRPRERQNKAHAAFDQLLHLLARAEQSADRQERLVQDLLDISRISSGRLEYRMVPHDLVALVHDAVEEQRLHAPARHIELTVPNNSVPVTTDADRTGQVLANLLTNALKYSDAATPITVTLCTHDTLARVAVRDQGPGLSPEQQRRLFERFYRVPGIKVLGGSGVGLGLGLYISKTIVEQHGGRVGVESTPGSGSTFWFELPLATPV